MRQIVKLTWEWPLATHHHPSLKGHLLGKKTICYHKGHQLSKTTVIIVPPPSFPPSYKKAIKIHTWNMTNFPLPWDDFYYDIYSSFISPSPSWILIKTTPLPPIQCMEIFPLHKTHSTVLSSSSFTWLACKMVDANKPLSLKGCWQEGYFKGC